MTRIVAGAARGRRLAVPPGEGTRPTSDRAREALFSTLGSLIRAWAGRRVLDLYAGSGAVGLEALSRGAAGVILV
ncbi:MAG TPA: RsmD family RNA methyltransferase, partial [Actinomycetes bacterium]